MSETRIDSIASKLEAIEACKTDIRSAIVEMGSSVSGGLPTYADGVRNIPKGAFSWEDLSGKPDVVEAVDEAPQHTGELEGQVIYDRQDSTFKVGVPFDGGFVLVRATTGSSELNFNMVLTSGDGDGRVWHLDGDTDDADGNYRARYLDGHWMLELHNGGSWGGLESETGTTWRVPADSGTNPWDFSGEEWTSVMGGVETGTSTPELKASPAWEDVSSLLPAVRSLDSRLRVVENSLSGISSSLDAINGEVI